MALQRMHLARMNLARMNLHTELARIYREHVPECARHHLTCSDPVSDAYAATSPEAGATGVAMSWAISPWARGAVGAAHGVDLTVEVLAVRGVATDPQWVVGSPGSRQPPAGRLDTWSPSTYRRSVAPW